MAQHHPAQPQPPANLPFAAAVPLGPGSDTGYAGNSSAVPGQLHIPDEMMVDELVDERMQHGGRKGLWDFVTDLFQPCAPRTVEARGTLSLSSTSALVGTCELMSLASF